MKKLFAFGLLLFALTFLVRVASATTTVTGHIANLGGSALTSNTYVRFWLRGCGGNQPRINGTAVIAPSQGGVYFFDLPANSSGNIAGTIYSTRDAAGTGSGEIECGGSETSTWYGMQIFYAGKGGPETPVAAKIGATLDISNVTPITTNPVTNSPTGDTTYARLDAGNQPFTGSISPSGTGVLSNGTTSNRWNFFGSTLDLSGSATLAGGGTFSGTFGGTPLFSGLNTFQAGVVSNFFRSSSANPAQSSPAVVRLSAGDQACWRNQANSGDICISKSGSDQIIIPSLDVFGATTLGQTIVNYNGIATAGNGVPAEYATVDVTAQTAAITTTTLYAVPSSGATQYRVSWNAKVTTAAGTSSTLGALTIVYTDPDGVAQTITMPASVAAGTIATTSTGNSTTTVLLGLPLMLNCKPSTNVTYAFAYASNAANAMAYNLHIKLEAQ